MTAHHRTPEWGATTRRMRPIIKAALPARCVDCGRLIYPEQKWQVGHIVSAAHGIRAGWTTAQINDPSNLGPTHAKGPGQKACNQIAGGKLGAQISNAKRVAKTRRFQW